MSEYLDRKQVIELYEKHHSHLATYVWEFGQELRQLPIVEQRPQGEWIKFTLEGGFLSSHKCSNCGFNGNQLWHFCPSCGADMRVKDELNRVSKELNRVSKELNSEIEKLKSEIVPDYRDGLRLREGDRK